MVCSSASPPVFMQEAKTGARRGKRAKIEYAQKSTGCRISRSHRHGPLIQKREVLHSQSVSAVHSLRALYPSNSFDLSHQTVRTMNPKREPITSTLDHWLTPSSRAGGWWNECQQLVNTAVAVRRFRQNRSEKRWQRRRHRRNGASVFLGRGPLLCTLSECNI